MITLEVHIATQKLYVLSQGELFKTYRISTAKNGVGEVRGSEKNPRGWHVIRAKIGANCPLNTVKVTHKNAPDSKIY